MSQFPHNARDEQAWPPRSVGGPGSGQVPGGGSWNGSAAPPEGAFHPSLYRAPERRHRGWAVAGGAFVVAASMVAGAGFGATVLGARTASAPPVVVPKSAPASGSSGVGGGFGQYGSSQPGQPGQFGSGQSGQANGPGDTSASSELPRATSAQQVGVVDIDTVLAYQGADAAGTGMVLTSNGEVLTNNHVVDGATSVKVTVVATEVTYTAKVVGTDPTQDVAVLQLQGASGLKTVRTDASAVAASEKVIGVGNAGGVGGAPSAASGEVTATGATITATDQGGANPETLHALIEVDADIQAGDSGGPLYNTSGRVVGMDTAAQATSAGDTTAGYAIPISTALHVATQIESGLTTSTVHQGYPAFLGISVLSDQPASVTGDVVQQVLANTSAARIGITAGDVITAVGSHQVTSPASLKATLANERPGQTVTVTWTDQQGQSHSATVVLAAGPAD